MIVNPGIRRFLGSAIQRLFNSASFYAPLTHSAIPERAATGTTATFTRATTKTWQNNDGYMVTGVAGEIGFVGARRIYNLWTTSSVSLANGANKSLTLPAGAYQFSMGAGTGTATFSGTGGATGTLDATIAGRVHVAKTITAGTLVITASVADLVDLQVVSLVDTTDQTTIREYVSVGVASDWWGTDSISNGNFSDGTTGWSAVNNGTLSVASGELTVTCGAAGNGTGEQAIATVVGQKYVVSATVRSGGAYAAYITASTTSGGFDLGSANTTSTSNVFLSFTFIATGTTTYIDCRNTAGVGFTGIYDNVSVKPAVYHGSMADGVKCFPTDLSGNPIPAATMLGYQAEGARTNLCLQSQTFDNAAWSANNVSLITSADQYVAPDGTTTMDKLTCGAGNSLHYTFIGGVAYTAAAHTASFYFRYVNHRWVSVRVNDTASNFYGSFDLLNGVAGAVSAGVTSKIEATGLANVYRVSITCTTILATNNLLIALNNSDNAGIDTWNAAGTEAIGAWGAQVELGSFASSYIATTTVAVTRNADVLTYPSAGNIDGTVGWCYAEVTTEWASGTSVYNAVIGSYTSSVGPLIGQGNAPTEIRLRDGTNSVSSPAFTSMATGSRKVASTWGGSDAKVTASGLTPTSGSFDGDMGFTNIPVGCTALSDAQWYGTIRNVRIGQRQLSASEMQAITAP